MSERRDEAGDSELNEAEFAGAQTLPGAVVCPMCNLMSAAGYCGTCGYELLSLLRAGLGVDPAPPAGARLEHAGQGVVLRVQLPCLGDAQRWLALDDAGARYEVVVTPRHANLDSSYLFHRATARAVLGDAVLTPTFAFDTATRRFTVTALPPVPSVADGLAALLADRLGVDVVAAIERWVLPLCTFVARWHAEGRFFGALDPAEILIDGEGVVKLREPIAALELSVAPVAPRRRRTPRGFSAPEVVGHQGGGVGPRTDVFFIGAVLYYALTRVAPLSEASLPSERLPPPQVYYPDVPPELAAVARRATSPMATRRYANAPELLRALRIALRTHTQRVSAGPRRLLLDIGHELHIGVLKGQFSPVNQDDLFLAFDAPSGVGFFMIADGVSISHHGTGDMASACVRQEAVELWQRICMNAALESQAAGDALPEATTMPGLPPRISLPNALDDRRRLVQEMLDGANRRIAELIHAEMPRFRGPAEGIMASTSVGVLLSGNRATLFSIGDSRAYLIRNGHISSLMIDDDLSTQLLRLGRPPNVARHVPAGGALVRCVGEFEKGDNDQLVPVPLLPGFRELTMLPDDHLVLCSDGIPDYAGTDEEDAEDTIRQVVEQAPGAPWAAFELMVAANRGGGGDNISCIVLHFSSNGPDTPDTEPAIAVTNSGGRS